MTRVRGDSRSKVENIRHDARDPRKLEYVNGSGLRDHKMFKVNRRSSVRNDGNDVGSSGELGNAYVTGLRDGKVKVIQGQMSETTGNVSGPLGKLTKLSD